MIDVSLIEAVEQRPNDLTLALSRYDRSQEFTVLNQQNVILNNWIFTFSILGESHLVSIYHDEKLSFQEILACVNISPDDCLHHHRFDDLQDTTYNKGRYSVEMSLQPDWSLRETYQMVYCFPKTQDYTPVTKIAWQSIEDSLYWWTLHEYPSVDCVSRVFTRSTLKGLSNGSTID